MTKKELEAAIQEQGESLKRFDRLFDVMTRRAMNRSRLNRFNKIKAMPGIEVFITKAND